MKKWFKEKLQILDDSEWLCLSELFYQYIILKHNLIFSIYYSLKKWGFKRR